MSVSLQDELLIDGHEYSSSARIGLDDPEGFLAMISDEAATPAASIGLEVHLVLGR